MLLKSARGEDGMVCGGSAPNRHCKSIKSSVVTSRVLICNPNGRRYILNISMTKLIAGSDTIGRHLPIPRRRFWNDICELHLRD